MTVIPFVTTQHPAPVADDSDWSPATRGVVPVSIRVVALDPALIGALVGAGAALIGATITSTAQYLNESRKLKIQETTRWDQQLLDLSVDLLARCEIIAPRNIFAGNYVESVRRSKVDFEAETLAVHNLLTHIELLGPERLHRRASNLSYACTAFFAQPIDENRTGHDHVFYDLKDAYDNYVAELKNVLSARKGPRFRRKVKSLAEKRGSVSTSLPKPPNLDTKH